MTSRSIRRATMEDVPELTIIRDDAHSKKIAHGDYAWGKEGDGFSETWVLANLLQKDVYVVEEDGIAVGVFSLELDDERHWGPQEPIAGYVHGLCVRNGFNGRGLGSFMLHWCSNKVSVLDRQLVRLDCPSHNATLCAYYESLGFVRVGKYQDPEPGGYGWSLYEKSALWVQQKEQSPSTKR
jgi:ribosomal protein S18 acetylase RimI-like enzyme